jgi:predicted Zn-ribbon and HTH transcriptional regulator
MPSTPPESVTPQSAPLKCPYCRSVNVRASRMRLPQDLFKLLFLQHPIRCRTCDYRFHQWLWVKTPMPEVKDRLD